MNTLMPVFRPCLAGFAFAASTLLSGQALAITPPSITAPLNAPLSVIGGIETDLSKARGSFDPAWLGGASNYTSIFDLSEMTKGGSLLLTEAAARVTFTLVGFEASYINVFSAGGQTLTNPNLGDSFSFENVSAGLLNFGFLSNGKGALKGNGSTATGLMLAKDNRSALILFNDNYFGDRDYDDMVVQMSVTPVPEPETFAMLLGGLGLLGFMARRRQRRA